MVPRPAGGCAPPGALQRRRGKALYSTAEGPDGGEDEGSDSGGASPPSMASPFASSSNLAGMIASAGVMAEAAGAPAAASLGPGTALAIQLLPGGVAAPLPGSVAPHAPPSDSGASPPGPAGWAPLSPLHAGSAVGAGAAGTPAGGEPFGAAAEAAAAGAAAAPEDLRLVVRSPQRVSSVGASDRGEVFSVPPDMDAWPTGQGEAGSVSAGQGLLRREGRATCRGTCGRLGSLASLPPAGVQTPRTRSNRKTQCAHARPTPQNTQALPRLRGAWPTTGGRPCPRSPYKRPTPCLPRTWTALTSGRSSRCWRSRACGSARPSTPTTRLTSRSGRGGFGLRVRGRVRGLIRPHNSPNRAPGPAEASSK